jgi:hypothetical protein
VTKKVFALDTRPGIQRDGTLFDKEFYADGRWVRFQRKRPRKMGGYREITPDLSGPSRGVFVVPRDNFNNVYNGYSDGVQVVPINNNGIGSGITDFKIGGPIVTLAILDAGSGYTNGTYTNQALTYPVSGSGMSAYATIVVAGGVITSVTITGGGMRFAVGDQITASIPGGTGFLLQVNAITSPFVASDDNLWQFDTFVDSANSQNNLLLAHPSQDLNNIDSPVDTYLLVGPVDGTILYAAGVFAQRASTITSGSPTVTLCQHHDADSDSERLSKRLQRRSDLRQRGQGLWWGCDSSPLRLRVRQRRTCPKLCRRKHRRLGLCRSQRGQRRYRKDCPRLAGSRRF